MRLSRILALTTCLQIVGLYIFLKGFLLTRQAINLKGHVYHSWDRFPLSKTPIQSTALPTSLTKSPFKRTIMIVIDALRFDFVFPNNQDTFYLNQLPLLSQLIQDQPQSSLLFQFRADPPTTTMQRVKGLMTGSLPTFIDAGANFASSAVGEDHLLDHIQAKYNNIYFFGDDTWVNLFPTAFQPNRTFESDSFKMLDLDSVDNHIEAHLWPHFNNNTDWQIVIAHFLGVDHCGHTYGPSDPNMKRKLNQMNSILKKIVDIIDQDTLLVVMGDHGMSVDGDHGGESIEELTSALFMYSKRHLKKSNTEAFSQRVHQERAKILGYDFQQISSRLSYDAYQSPMVAQIHLVPTLAYLLNVPIPFGNLGAVIPDVMFAEKGRDDYLHMVEQIRKNALQVYHYLDQYEQQTHQYDFSKEKLKPILQHFVKADEILLDLFQKTDFLKVQSKDTDVLLQEAFLAYDAFLMNTIKYCGAIWAQFDAGCMLVGIVLLGASTLLSIWFIFNGQAILPFTTSSALPGLVCFSLGTILVYLRYTTFATYFLQQGWFEKMSLFDWVCSLIGLSSCCIMVASTPFSFKSHSSDFYISIISVLCQSLTLGSNSFVVWEDRSSRFMIITLSLVWLQRQFRSVKEKSISNVLEAIICPILFMVLIRLMGLTGQCREEQFPHCDYFHSGQLEFRIDNNLGYFTIGLMVFTFTVITYSTSTLTDHSMIICGLYHCSGMMVIFRMMYEVVQKTVTAAEKSELALKLQKYMDVYLPRVVYGFCSLGILLVLTTNILHTRYKRYDKRALKIWTLMMFISMVLALLQKPLGSAIMVFSPLLMQLLTMGDASSQWTRLSLVYFLGHYLFYVTGHQATMTSLPWKAAFLGFEDMNYYGGMILVTLSTLAGYIMSWIGWTYIIANNSEATTFLLAFFQSIPTFLSAIFIFVLKRHLMTWKIFAPRFLLQVLLEIGVHFVISLFY